MVDVVVILVLMLMVITIDIIDSRMSLIETMMILLGIALLVDVVTRLINGLHLLIMRNGLLLRLLLGIDRW